MPIAAIGIGMFLSGLNVSYKRPACKKSKKHAKLMLSWKGSRSMGALISLILAGVGIFGRDTTNRQKQEVLMAMT